MFSPLMAEQRRQFQFGQATGGSSLHRGEGTSSDLEKVTDRTAAKVIYKQSEKKFHQGNEQGV